MLIIDHLKQTYRPTKLISFFNSQFDIAVELAICYIWNLFRLCLILTVLLIEV